MWQAIIRCWLSISIDEAGVEFCERVDRDEEQTSDAERLSLLFDDALRPPCITAVFVEFRFLRLCVATSR